MTTIVRTACAYAPHACAISRDKCDIYPMFPPSVCMAVICKTERAKTDVQTDGLTHIIRASVSRVRTKPLGDFEECIEQYAWVVGGCGFLCPSVWNAEVDYSYLWQHS